MLTNDGTDPCLVVRGDHDEVYYRFYDVVTESWSDWTAFAYGTTPDTPAATIVGDNLEIVVRGSNDDQIWHGTLDLTTDVFGGWTMVDGATPSRPILTS